MTVLELMTHLIAFPPNTPVTVRGNGPNYDEDEEYQIMRVAPGGTMGGDLPADRVILYVGEE